MSFHKYPYVSTWSTSSPSLLVPGAVKKTSPAHSRSVSSRSISRAVRGARAPAKSQQMRPEPFRSRACVPVTESLWTQAGSDRNLLVDRPLPFALFGCCFIYVNSLLSPDLFQCEARSREDLLRPSLVCLQMCSPRSQPQRKTRAFFFFLSLSLSLPAARRRRR